MFDIIVATDVRGGIGFRGRIPWVCKEDLVFFKEKTTHTKNQNKKNAVIMGRKTFESLPRRKPLPDRINIVITRNEEYLADNIHDDLVVCHSIEDSLRYVQNHKKRIETAFVIGGAEIYNEFLKRNLISNVYITRLKKAYVCDTYFNPSLEKFTRKYLIVAENEMNVYKWIYHNEEEQNYLNLMQEILDNGVERSDRTGVGTISLFAKSLEYDLRSGTIPLLTTKFIPFRIIVEELLWMMRGSTNVRELQEKNIHIWDGNSSREFLDKQGLHHLEEGDIGEGYGFNLRYFGGEYPSGNNGTDQLEYVMDLLENNPTSRRILFSYWNPARLGNVSLPPCFLKDTLVITDNGYKPIQNVELTDKLMTHNYNFQSINQKFKTLYSGDIYELNLQYQTKSINLTPNHPMYVRKVKYNNNPKLQFIEKSEPEWLNAENLTTDHYCGIPINQKSIIPEFKITKGVKSYTRKLNDEGEWFLLGYYLGDGWAQQDSKYGTFYLVFNNQDEKELVPKFRKYCTLSVKERRENHVTYRCYSYDLVHILKQFGHMARSKEIPEWIQDAPTNFIENFIEGYEKADSCAFYADNNWRTTITTTSEKIAYGLQRLYLKIGHFASIRFQERPSQCIIEGRIVNQRDTYSIDTTKVRKRQIRSFIEDAYAWVPILDITTKNVEDEYVYNFDVEKDHTYIVNNLATHNCHLMYQFYVNPRTNELSGCLYQRSSDYFLANNFNAVALALWVHIFCHLFGYKPGKITHFFADTHIYINHLEACQTQLKRVPDQPFPKISISEDVKYIEDFTFESFELLNYFPQPRIQAKMAV